MTNDTTPQGAAAPSDADTLDLLKKYKKLCIQIGRGDGHHLQRIDNAIAKWSAPQTPVAEVRTGDEEADRILDRLASSDPDFDDCDDACALIIKLMADRGPDGHATWKDAAIAERLHRVELEQTHRRSAKAMPSDEEIMAWAMEHQPYAIKNLRASGFVQVARAVLARWGASQAAGQPLPLTDEQCKACIPTAEVTENGEKKHKRMVWMQVRHALKAIRNAERLHGITGKAKGAQQDFDETQPR